MRRPLFAVLAALVACRSATVPGDAATRDAAAAKPSGTGTGALQPWSQPTLDPTKAEVVELRDRRTESRKEHDVVFRLVREGNEYAWTAKGVAVGTLGERVPDPAPILKQPYATQCICGVTVKCDCEHAEGGDAIVSKTGRVDAAKVEAILTLLARPLVGPVDPDAGRSSYRPHTAHLVAFFTGREYPVHWSMTDGPYRWIADGLPMVPEPGADASAEPMPTLDAAWAKLLEDLDVPKWDLVLNPPPPPGPPSDFASLAKATSLDVYDSWDGLGTTHAMFAHLVRTATGFAMKAKIASSSYDISEPLHDPFDPKGTRAVGDSCACAVDATCACERGVTKKSGNVPAAPVEAFLAEVARHALDSGPPMRGGWTDDYPRGHTVVWVSPGAKPIHLSFLDQARQWRVNGRELKPDPPPPGNASMLAGAHPVINVAYRNMLDAIGLSAWIKDMKGRGGR